MKTATTHPTLTGGRHLFAFHWGEPGCPCFVLNPVAIAREKPRMRGRILNQLHMDLKYWATTVPARLQEQYREWAREVYLTAAGRVGE